MLAGFAVSCGASACEFEGFPARLDAGSEAPQFSKSASSGAKALLGEDTVIVSGAASGGINREASGAVGGAVSSEANAEILASATGAGLAVTLTSDATPDLISDGTADFTFASGGNKLRFGLKLTPPFGATAEPDFKAALASSLAPSFCPDSVPDPAPALPANFAVVAATVDRFCTCSGARLDTQEASAAVKLAIADGGGCGAVEATAGAAGMTIASTCIGVPRDR
ncbi:MAG: hypothetical protein WCF68_06210 [Terriglobales bacterium]